MHCTWVVFAPKWPDIEPLVMHSLETGWLTLGTGTLKCTKQCHSCRLSLGLLVVQHSFAGCMSDYSMSNARLSDAGVGYTYVFENDLHSCYHQQSTVK